MTRAFVGLATAILFATSLSCDKEKEKAAEPAAVAPSAAVVATAAPVVAASAAPAEVENIPVAADFEEEAEKTITKANYKAELDTLEAELKR
jgi:hypothetical protein